MTNVTTTGAIMDYKRSVIQKFVDCEELIAAMANDDIVEPDEAVYKYIFPYSYIPYVVESAHSYIAVKAIMTSRSKKNKLYGNFSVIVTIIVNQEIMKAEGTNGATRLDYISNIVEQLLDGSEAFGTKRLEIYSNIEETSDLRHRCRVLTFTTTDINGIEC